MSRQIPPSAYTAACQILLAKIESSRRLCNDAIVAAAMRKDRPHMAWDAAQWVSRGCSGKRMCVWVLESENMHSMSMKQCVLFG